MQRKPSVIMSAAERKEARTRLGGELKAAKARKRKIKSDLVSAEREVVGIETRLEGLKRRPKKVSA